MTTATQRIPVLVTPVEKSEIAHMAQAAGLSMGEFLRRAAASFRPSEEDEMLEGMLRQMHKTCENANLAMDKAFAFIAASNKRMAAMEGSKR